ncbi:MAG: PQQ-dependent sugar dehydrogenase, partial [Deltaproteobacteria bacterium]
MQLQNFSFVFLGAFIGLLFTLNPLYAERSYTLKKIVDRLQEPLFLTSARDGSGRLFIVEQEGKIKIMRKGVLEKKLFLDISDRVKAGGERGLLGLAFHPKFKTNRKFYLNYTTETTHLKTRVSEFLASSEARDSERILLEFDQPYSNHNGGHLEFGPDGYLYISVGDGGSAGDPQGHGQNLSTLLGSILRID